MLRNLTLIIVIILEQFGISGVIVPEKPGIVFEDYEKDNASYISEIEPLPEEKDEIRDLNLGARSYLAMDLKTGNILAQKDSEIIIPMASLTKVMTAVVVLENCDLDERITVSDNAISTYGVGIALRAGEHFKVSDLLYAALLNSSNDSSVALAEHIAGSETEFVDMMNQKARELSLSQTTFKNSTGLDDVGHLSSSQDLAKLSRYALLDETFSKIVATDRKTITSEEGINHYLTNSNKLMGGSFLIKGIKTGYTEEAGQCLITLAENNSREILTVILGSSDRFGETKKLLEWSLGNYQW